MRNMGTKLFFYARSLGASLKLSSLLLLLMATRTGNQLDLSSWLKFKAGFIW